MKKILYVMIILLALSIFMKIGKISNINIPTTTTQQIQDDEIKPTEIILDHIELIF